MKLAVFGPTGATGAQIVRQALAAGHEVTAVARRPDVVALTDPRLRVVPGDVLDPASLREGVVGADAVLSALGSRQMNLPTKVYSAGTAAVLAAMRDAGVRRFVGLSAVPVGPEDQKSVLDRYLVHPLLHRFLGGGYDDMRQMEELLATSDRDWTVFRPAQLTNRAPTGRYRTAVDGPLPRAWRISRADLAAAFSEDFVSASVLATTGAVVAENLVTATAAVNFVRAVPASNIVTRAVRVNFFDTFSALYPVDSRSAFTEASGAANQRYRCRCSANEQHS